MASLRDTCPELELPPRVACLGREIQAAGGEGYLVGGVVRDALRGKPSQDYDLATSLRPDQLAAVVGEEGSFDPQLGFWHLRDGELELTCTCFRADGPYSDRRRPDHARFGVDLDEDAQRRDFSCNAIYAELGSLRLIDPLDGRADLAAGLLRMIGAPGPRLHEDPLRLLRALRFAAGLDLQIEAETAAAIRAEAAGLQVLAVERCFTELTRMFCAPGRGRALRLLLETGLAAELLPEILGMSGVPQPPEYHPEGDVFVHVCLVLDHVLPDDPIQAWAAVLHDTGKPATFERAADRIRFSGHDTLSAEIAERVLRRFRAPRELRETVVEICRDHIRIASIRQMKRVRRERWMRDPRFRAHLEFHRADCLGSHGKLEIYHEVRAALAQLPELAPPPLCGGADVLALGVPQGPMVGQVLRQLQDWCEDRGVQDRDQALGQLAQLVEERFRGTERGDDRP